MRVSNLNGVGESLDPPAVAKAVYPKVVAHQAARRSPIVICIDRERRPLSAEDFGRAVTIQLARLLRDAGRDSDNIFVVAADRAFEAWILADAQGLFTRGTFVVRPTFNSFEGERGREDKLGVVELTALLERPYKKTRDGPRLFARINLADARAHGPGARGSKSLDTFLTALG